MRLVLRYSRAYRWRYVLLVLLVVAQGSAQLLGLTHEMKNIVDLGIQAGHMDYLYESSLRMILFTALVGLCGTAVTRLGTSIACSIRRDMTRDCYRRIVGMSSQEMARYGGATLLTRCITDTENVQRLLVYVLGICLLSPVITVLMLVSLFQVDRPALLAQGIAVLLAFGIMMVLMTVARKRYPTLQNSLDWLNSLMKEKISGVRTIRAYGREEDEARRGEEADRQVFEADLAANRPLKCISPVVLTIMNLLMVLIVWIGARRAQSGLLQISTLLLTIQYVNTLIPSLSVLPIVINMLPAAEVGLSRIGELLDSEGGLPEADGHGEPMDEAVPAPLKNDSGEGEPVLEFQDVTFGYEGQKAIVSGLNFTIRSGERVGVVGATGSGKSTLLALMCGLLTPQSGRIMTRGKDLKELDRAERNALFSYVPQKAIVFQDSVLENIRAYQRDMEEARIRSACDASGFSEVIESLEQGMDTVMAQGGMNLSGGQRKRLSLARGLARDAEIYLLDDPFAALDAVTEKRVRENTLRALKGRTLILVAQRFQTLRDFDRILVMRQGEIIAAGTHEELLAECGEYADMARTQSYLERR